MSGIDWDNEIINRQVDEILRLEAKLKRKDEALREIAEDASKKYTCDSYLDMGWEDGYSPEARLRKIGDKAREALKL